MKNLINTKYLKTLEHLHYQAIQNAVAIMEDSMSMLRF